MAQQSHTCHCSPGYDLKQFNKTKRAYASRCWFRMQRDAVSASTYSSGFHKKGEENIALVLVAVCMYAIAWSFAQLLASPPGRFHSQDCRIFLLLKAHLSIWEGTQSSSLVIKCFVTHHPRFNKACKCKRLCSQNCNVKL